MPVQTDLLCKCCGDVVQSIESEQGIESELPEWMCTECLGLYSVARLNMGEASREQVLDTTRLLRLFRSLPDHHKDKLERLLMLLRNNSSRAKRLTQMAADGQMSLEHLLSII